MMIRTFDLGGTRTVSFQVSTSQGFRLMACPVSMFTLLSTWKRTRCTCIGCIMLVGFSNSQTSRLPRIGNSERSSQCLPIVLPPGPSSDSISHSLTVRPESSLQGWRLFDKRK